MSGGEGSVYFERAFCHIDGMRVLIDTPGGKEERIYKSY